MHVSSILSVLGGNYLDILLNDSSNCSLLIYCHPPQPHEYAEKNDKWSQHLGILCFRKPVKTYDKQ